MAGLAPERQERGVINAIQSAVRKNKKNPITVKAGKTLIPGVIDAKKFTGRQAGGSEPYTDVVLVTCEKKEINLSLKGESAPSLAGGGLKGLELAVPGIAKRFMTEAFEHLTKRLKLNPGDKVPDVYGKINPRDKVKIVVGNTKMGGPIDYMYIGPMNVQSRYDVRTNTLIMNGELTEANHYAKTHELYFRLRARREDQRFDPTAKDASGTPRIYGKSPSRGDSIGRIVVASSTPRNAEMVQMR